MSAAKAVAPTVVYVLTGCDLGLLEDEKISDVLGDVLAAPSVFLTFAGASAAAQQDLDEWVKDIDDDATSDDDRVGPLRLEWKPLADSTDAAEAHVEELDQYYRITPVKVQP